NSCTWRAIDPSDMSTNKASDIPRSRQLFHQRHFTPYADHPVCHAPCCVRHSLFYCVTYPPSTLMACPVTNEAPSEQSQTTASAISSGLPSRPVGSVAMMRALSLG